MWKIVFFVALWVVALTMVIWIIRVAVYKIQIKILENKYYKLFSKSRLLEDEWNKMIKFEKEWNKKEINKWINIYKSWLEKSKKDTIDEIYVEISKVIDGYKEHIWNEILKLSENYKEQEEKIKWELVKIECGDTPSLYNLWMWSILLFWFWAFWWFIYALIKFL